MEYMPRYAQPFTLEEARQLAVPIISEEITRLQNSLTHLQRTQDELRDALSTSPDDSDFTQAFEENEVVIGSQRERITILRMVLVEKGVPMNAHYDLPPRSQGGQTHAAATSPQPDGVPVTASTLTEHSVAHSTYEGSGENSSQGVYL
ncbi:hypothetical protein BD414DRAFT_473469 [Trametes punicea]|nr:hypothetical protein BD414DRAFT_473469 [Trametes punicea]